MSIIVDEAAFARAGPSDKSFITIDQRKLAGVVGLVALFLPTVMIVAAFTKLTPFAKTCYRDSISHYYYAPFLGSIFIGALVFIGAYLLVYQGTKQRALERRLSTAAGLFAMAIALFPTSGAGCQLHKDGDVVRARAFLPFDKMDGVLEPQADGTLITFFQLFELQVFGFTLASSAIHYLAAAFLFGFLAWFSLKVFTRVDPHQRQADGTLTQQKQIRNALYYATGGIIIFCIIAMALGFYFDPPWWDANKLTFWFETAALWAFGIGWLVKARFLGKTLEDPDRV